jgi:hypothetical protein
MAMKANTRDGNYVLPPHRVRTCAETAIIMNERHPEAPVTPEEVYRIERAALAKLHDQLIEGLIKK